MNGWEEFQAEVHRYVRETPDEQRMRDSKPGASGNQPPPKKTRRRSRKQKKWNR